MRVFLLLLCFLLFFACFLGLLPSSLPPGKKKNLPSEMLSYCVSTVKCKTSEFQLQDLPILFNKSASVQ